MSYSFLFKYIIIGDSGVGKSCLLLQFTDKRYRDKHEVTIGVEFGTKNITIGQNNIKLQIWDTAGQQSFQAITRGYYRSAIGAIVCYDISSRQSFEHITKWLSEAQSNAPASLSFVIVGNKSDKQGERKVPFQEGLKLAKQKNMPFIEASAKNGTNVQQIFNSLTENILNKIQSNQVNPRDHPGIKLGTEQYIQMSEPGEQPNLKKQENRTIVIKGSNTKKKKQKSGCC